MYDVLTFKEPEYYLKAYFKARRRMFSRIKIENGHWIYCPPKGWVNRKTCSINFLCKEHTISAAAYIFWNHLKSLDSKKLNVMSSCKVRNCVHPHHLFLASPGDKTKLTNSKKGVKNGKNKRL